MGLDVSHDAFHGAYSAFNRFRMAVCWAAGGSFPPHVLPERLKELKLEEEKNPNYWDEKRDPPKAGIACHNWWYVPDGVTKETHPGLYLFLSHSDCDGTLTPDECRLVASDLEKLVDVIGQFPLSDEGHIRRDGGYRAVLERFIAGCRLAAERNEVMDFH